MLIFLIPIVIGFSVVALASIGNKVANGKAGTKFERWCFKHDTPLSASAFFSLILFAAMLLGLAISHIEYASFPAEYEAVTMTLAESRNTGSSDIERAAVMHKIIDMNKKIASVRYWNDSIWVGWFIPDKAAKLELIR